MQCWARYFKKVISYITSYFSQIVTEYIIIKKLITRESNYCYFFFKCSNYVKYLGCPQY